MSVIKSYSVGNGDMFYIDHNTDNFTIIDCCLNADTAEEILPELAYLAGRKGVTRFISTHADDDHIRGLDLLDDKLGIRNFYCVENQATKEDETDCFTRYCELRNSSKAFYIKKDCTRRWMNESNEERKSSGIHILWPDPKSTHFQDALLDAADGGSPNNISPIVKYGVGDKITALWMGDLETSFMEDIEDSLDFPKVSLLFAPHHGRYSGRVPHSLLKKMSPKIIIIGEAPSEHLHYYDGYNTITQNGAGDILFDCRGDDIHIFSSNKYYVDFLTDFAQKREGYHYIGTLSL